MTKRSWLACIYLALTSQLTLAQVSLDTIMSISGMGYDFKTVQLSDNETKYFRADTVDNTFSLYNLDWSPFIMDVEVPVPFSSTFQYQAIYVTRTLFDCDSTNIEYMYTAPVHGGFERSVYIMRTDGTQLFMMDSAFCPYAFGQPMGGSDWVKPIVNTSDGARMFILRTFNTSEISMYSLCGGVPNQILELSGFRHSMVNAFPNPTGQQITFEISPTDNIEPWRLIIFDQYGNSVFETNPEYGQSRFKIDLSTFSSGTYIYRLRSESKSLETGKIVLTE